MWPCAIHWYGDSRVICRNDKLNDISIGMMTILIWVTSRGIGINTGSKRDLIRRSKVPTTLLKVVMLTGSALTWKLKTYRGHNSIARPRTEAGAYSARCRGMLKDSVANATPTNKRSILRNANSSRREYWLLIRRIARHALSMARVDAVRSA